MFRPDLVPRRGIGGEMSHTERRIWRLFFEERNRREHLAIQRAKGQTDGEVGEAE